MKKQLLGTNSFDILCNLIVKPVHTPLRVLASLEGSNVLAFGSTMNTCIFVELDWILCIAIL